VIWDRPRDEEFTPPADKPLTVVSYAAGKETVGYVEPAAVGDVLPERPLFLAADRYVPCPLETTYQGPGTSSRRRSRIRCCKTG
jgi:hypothetical protein